MQPISRPVWLRTDSKNSAYSSSLSSSFSKSDSSFKSSSLVLLGGSSLLIIMVLSIVDDFHFSPTGRADQLDSHSTHWTHIRPIGLTLDQSRLTTVSTYGPDFRWICSLWSDIWLNRQLFACSFTLRIGIIESFAAFASLGAILALDALETHFAAFFEDAGKCRFLCKRMVDRPPKLHL